MDGLSVFMVVRLSRVMRFNAFGVEAVEPIPAKDLGDTHFCALQLTWLDGRFGEISSCNVDYNSLLRSIKVVECNKLL